MKVLLEKIGAVLKHQEALKIAKGETFNIFSILRMERAEVKTHSAFLAELLNPKGSHLMGSVFLEAFLSVINYPTEIATETKTKIDITTAKVFVEYYIGIVTETEGGRIDILIKDAKKTCITIENKIDAGDQDNQLVRYKNYNTATNTVYYLNLDGKDPSDDSKGELEPGNHFYIISYRDQIIAWLQKCLALSVEQPLLRESIKQYLLLIKKITNTLDNTQEKEVANLIINHLEESEQIADKYNKVLEEIRENFRTKLEKYLTKLHETGQLLEGFEVIKNHLNANDNYSGIWMPKTGNPKKMFGVSSFSGKGHVNGDMFIGLYDQINKEKYPVEFYNNIISNPDWVHHLLLTYDFNGDSDYKINLGDKKFIKYIADENNLKSVLEKVKPQIDKFIKENKKHL